MKTERGGVSEFYEEKRNFVSNFYLQCPPSKSIPMSAQKGQIYYRVSGENDTKSVSMKRHIRTCIDYRPITRHPTLNPQPPTLSSGWKITCVAGRRKGGKSVILPGPIFSRFTRSSFPRPFPSPSDACHEG